MEKEANILDNLSEADLKTGDVIFTLDTEGVAGHVAIWAPVQGSLLPMAHAVHSGGIYKVTKTDILPDNYVVYRTKDENLAQLAADIANRWCRYESPYDEVKLQIGERMYNARTHKYRNAEDKKKVAYHATSKAFDYSGRYRMIKYASRRMGPMHLPKGAGSGRGAWCAMFVLMCYQTAAMVKHELVEAISGGDKYPWISDKYTDIKALTLFAPKKPTSFSVAKLNQFAKNKRAWKHCIKDYSEHIKRTRSHQEFEGYKHYVDHQQFDENHTMYPPSIVAWDFETNGDLSQFDFEEVLSLGLMLEQKTLDPEIFMYSLSLDNGMWESPGVVHIEEKIITDEEKVANSNEQDAVAQQAKKINNDMIRYFHGEIKKLPTFDKDVENERCLLSQFKK